MTRDEHSRLRHRASGGKRVPKAGLACMVLLARGEHQSDLVNRRRRTGSQNQHIAGPGWQRGDHPIETDHECYNGARPRFFLVEGSGVIVSETMTRAEREMLLGLAEVVQRIDVEANIRYLSQAELTSVLNAEAYRYRGLVENSEGTPFFPAVVR